MNVIIQRHGKGFKAFLQNNPAIWEAGELFYTALAKLVEGRQKELGLKIIELKVNEPVPAPDPQPFTDRTYRFERFYQPHGTEGEEIKVGITGDCYDREIEYIQFLLMNLRNSIPFEFVECSQPRIEILAGRRINGQVLVEMNIKTTETDKDRFLAMAALKLRNFKYGLELVR